MQTLLRNSQKGLHTLKLYQLKLLCMWLMTLAYQTFYYCAFLFYASWILVLKLRMSHRFVCSCVLTAPLSMWTLIKIFLLSWRFNRFDISNFGKPAIKYLSTYSLILIYTFLESSFLLLVLALAKYCTAWTVSVKTFKFKKIIFVI